jgi:hypothetical protein
VKIISTTALSYTLADAVTGETYRYKLLATNIVGDSPMSEESIDIIAALLPGQPG